MRMRHAFRSSTIALVAVALLAGCGSTEQSSSPEARQRDATRATREALAERAAALARAERPDSPLTQVDATVGQFAIPAAMMKTTPGRTARAYGFDNEPRAILVADDGSMIVATRQPIGGSGNFMHVVGTENEVRFPYASPNPVNALHWNADGTAFIATSEGVGLKFPWPPESDTAGENIGNRPTRRVYFNPSGEGVLLAEDLVDFGATTPTLVAWNLSEHTGEGSSDPLARALPLSTIGTFPQLNLMWGHKRQDWRLFPDEAPIYSLNAMFEATTPLTNPGTDVDIRPQAARDGRLWFIRAPRQIFSDTGGMGIAPNARAWTVELDGNSETMATAEPTLDVAVSPDGSRVAFLVAREGELLAVVNERDIILANDLATQRTASEDFRSRMLRVAEGVEAAFLLTAMGRAELEDTPLGPIPTVAPTVAGVSQLSATLRQQLEEQFEIVLDEGVAKLGVIDGLLAEGDGLWNESPAIVVALAGVYAEALREENPDSIEWYLDLAQPDLSYGLDTATFFPGNLVLGAEDTTRPVRVRVTGIAQMHSPFYVARERLAGRMALDVAAREVIGNRARPILLVENFDAGNLNVALATYAQRAGLDLTGEDMESFARVAALDKENTLANLAVFLVARQQRLPELTLAAALNLAETINWSADTLLLTVEPLMWIGQHERAIEIAELAARNDPANPEVLFDVALAHYDDLNFDKAEEFIALAEEADDLGQLRTFIDQTRAMIADSRAREAAQEDSQ